MDTNRKIITLKVNDGTEYFLLKSTISMKIVRCNCFTAVMRRINMHSEWKWNVSIVIKWKDMIKYDNGD